METKKAKTLTIIGVVTLLVTVVGATYAYFIAQGGTSSNKAVTVKTNTTDSLVFNTGDPISITADMDNFGETNTNREGTTFASAELKANNATNSAKDHYYVYLNISKNEFTYTTTDKKAELILNVTDNTGNEVTISSLTKKSVVDNKGNTISGYDITEAIGVLTLIDKDIETNSTTFEKWNIKITFVNLNSDQNDNTGKSFNAELKITKDKLIKFYISLQYAGVAEYFAEEGMSLNDWLNSKIYNPDERYLNKNGIRYIFSDNKNEPIIENKQYNVGIQ